MYVNSSVFLWDDLLAFLISETDVTLKNGAVSSEDILWNTEHEVLLTTVLARSFPFQSNRSCLLNDVNGLFTNFWFEFLCPHKFQ